MTNLFSKILIKIYETLLKEKASLEVKKFFQNLNYTLIGFGFAGVIGFIFQILVGRFLGPSDYGIYVLIQSVAMFLFIPITMGIPGAMIKYNAEKEDRTRQKKIISTVYIIIFLCIFIFSLIILFFSSYFLKIFEISRKIFLFSFIFALFYSIYTLAIATLQGLHEMKKISIFQSIYGIMKILLFLFFIFFGIVSYEYAILSIIISYGAIFCLILIFLYQHKLIDFSFNKFWAIKIGKYGFYSSIASISSAIYLNFDKIIINKYLTITDVGIYTAYYFSFIIPFSILYNIFNTVYFPTVSKYQNKEKIFIRINKIAILGGLIFFLFIIVFGSILFQFYGKNYPFSFKIAIFFSLASILVLFNNIYTWLMSATGERGARVVSLANIFLGAINIFLNLFLIHKIGILGGAISLILSYGVSLEIVLFKRKYFQLQPEIVN